MSFYYFISILSAKILCLTWPYHDIDAATMYATGIPALDITDAELRKSPIQVNVINILKAAFLPISFPQNIINTNCRYNNT